MRSGGVRGYTFAKHGKHLVSQMGRGTIDSDRSLALPGLNQVDQINLAQGPIGATLGYLLRKDVLANTPTRTYSVSMSEGSQDRANAIVEEGICWKVVNSRLIR